MLVQVNTDDWSLYYPVSDFHKQIDPSASGTAFYFPLGVQILRYLANNWGKHAAQFQNKTQERLLKDKNLQEWKRRRTTLNIARYFNKYRRGHYRRYNDEAMAFCVGERGDAVKNCCSLLKEIQNSRILVPHGQTVFHGGSFDQSATSLDIPKFLSTSLDPVVACWHAKTSKSGVALAIRLEKPLRALWASTSTLREFELLFQCGLNLRIDSIFVGSDFSVMETTLVDHLVL